MIRVLIVWLFTFLGCLAVLFMLKGHNITGIDLCAITGVSVIVFVIAACSGVQP